jgi:predicted transcriptional regulator
MSRKVLDLHRKRPRAVSVTRQIQREWQIPVKRQSAGGNYERYTSRAPEISEMTATAALLDTARNRLGLTSDYQLANALGWPNSTVSSYRTGRRAMELEQVVAFAGKTGIALEEVAKVAIEDRARIKALKKGAPIQTSLNLAAA